MSGFHVPGQEEFTRFVELYDNNEPRGQVYFDALNYIRQTWGNPANMAEGIKILLHGWHWNFYRFGDFDMELLEKCIEENLLLLNRFRNRKIRTLSSDDEIEIKELFDKFLDALKGGKRKSPVAVSKALHLLCPAFFPLWDNDIALEYGYVWGGIAGTILAASDYVSFSWKMKEMAEHITNFFSDHEDRSLLKRIDEYNFAKSSRFAADWK